MEEHPVQADDEEEEVFDLEKALELDEEQKKQPKMKYSYSSLRLNWILSVTAEFWGVTAKSVLKSEFFFVEIEFAHYYYCNKLFL